MWLFTPFGFFSVVRKRGDAHLTVRARVAADLDALRRTHAPTLSATVTGAGTDYPYRATVALEDWARAMASIGGAIDYANFKDEVHARQGETRARAYAKVWDVMDRLTGAEASASRPPR
jgi:hypothetical protein